MTGQKIGYVRVSTADQNTDRQLDGMILDRVFTDKLSGKNVDRPQLTEMLAYARDGDVVFVHSMDRLARNLTDLRRIVSQLTDRGVCIEFIKEKLVFNGDDSPMSNLMLSVMGAFSEFERALILERQREGITQAKKRGVYQGRKKALDSHQVAKMQDLLRLGTTKSAVARQMGITRMTLYRYLSVSIEKAKE